MRFNTIILFLLCFSAYGQSENYDTLDVKKVFLVYSKYDGTQIKIPFRTTDSLVNQIFGKPTDSVNCSGCAEYSIFHESGTERSPFFQKIYLPDTNLTWNKPLDSCFHSIRNFSVGFWSYKHIMEISGFGFNNQFFSLKVDSLILNSQTTLKQFVTYFPSSVKYQKDLTRSYQLRYERKGICFPTGTTYTQITLATNLRKYNNSWKVIFKNNQLWRIYLDIGT